MNMSIVSDTENIIHRSSRDDTARCVSPITSEQVEKLTRQVPMRIDLAQEKIQLEGSRLKNDQGQTLWLRGVNLCAKTPNGHELKHEGVDFYDHRNVSFVDHPISLKAADEHLLRLKLWGFTLIRLGVTWEALEHAGPGQYDESYILYLIALVGKLQLFGFKVIIDPHQDVWSRYSGGSGAPGWTFEVAGMDLTKFRVTGAAHVYRWHLDQQGADEQTMLWPSNYSKLATQTMFTLFFGGNTFAPQARYKGESIQDFLQDCYCKCFAHLASRLKQFPCLLGFEVMNEPHYGFIGLSSLKKRDYNKALHLGYCPNALQSFALAEGISQHVDFYVRSFPFPTKKNGTKVMNTERENMWLNGKCLWREVGVWGFEKPKQKASCFRRHARILPDEEVVPVLLKPNYFSSHPVTGDPISFDHDFYLPFVRRYAEAIVQASNETMLIFVGPVPNESFFKLTPEEGLSLGVGKNMVFAPHWYDMSMLFSKSFDGMVTFNVQALSNGSRNFYKHTFLGQRGTRRNYLKQVRHVIQMGETGFGATASQPNPVPVFFGECGIPMDVNDHEGFWYSDYRLHNMALDCMFAAMDQTQVAMLTLWNYYPQNSVHHGDRWNGEDFSIFSTSEFSKQMNKKLEQHRRFEKFYVGGRALEAIIRPYAFCVAGSVVKASFDLKRTVYHLEFRTTLMDNRKETEQPRTEIYVPDFHFHVPPDTAWQQCIKVDVGDGSVQFFPEHQLLVYVHDQKIEFHSLKISLLRPSTITDKKSWWKCK